MTNEGQEDQNEDVASKKDMRQIIKDKLKSRQKARIQKKRADNKADSSYKTSSSNTKLTDYDLLPKEDQDKYFAPDGTCLFIEMTGETSYPQFIIDRAFDMYFDGLTLDSIAASWGIKLSTVANWHRKQHWQDKMDKFKQSVDEQYTKEKTKEIVTKRQKIDEKHEQTLNWLWMELQWEMNKPYPAEAQLNEKAQLNFEMRRNLRMKTWQITINCYKTLIDTERFVTGVDQVEENERQLPSDFKFILELPTGASVPDLDALRSVLPSQDPYGYDVNAIGTQQGNTTQALTDGSETPQMPPNIQSIISNAQGSSMPIPEGERKKPLEPVVIHPVVIPRPGMNVTPPPSHEAPKPHPVYGYLDMGQNRGF